MSIPKNIILLSTAFFISTTTFVYANYEPIIKEYEGSDKGFWAALFKGEYINFGYWEKILPKKGKITIDERIQSGEALYTHVIDILNISKNDVVVEIGCGRGCGCAKIMGKYNPKRVIGIDITSEQIERSYKIHRLNFEKYPQLSFIISQSERTTLPDESVNKIYSVEVAQHFLSMQDFAKEAYRILKPGGTIVFTTYFSTSQQGAEAVRKMILWVAEGKDNVLPIADVQKAFSQNGFKEIQIQSIGKKVFEGYDIWASQVLPPNCSVSYTRKWYETFLKGYLDYYVIIAKK